MSLFVSVFSIVTFAKDYPQGINDEVMYFTEEELEQMRLSDIAVQEYMEERAKQRAMNRIVLNDISEFVQQRDNWCGPATLEIILDYFWGYAPEQEEIATDLGIVNGGGTNPYMFINYINDCPLASDYDYATTSQTVWNHLVYSIDYDYPVGLNLDLFDMPGAIKEGHGGHWVVGYGFSHNDAPTNTYKVVYIMEPWDGWNDEPPGTYHSGPRVITFDELLIAMAGNVNGGYIAKKAQ